MSSISRDLSVRWKEPGDDRETFVGDYKYCVEYQRKKSENKTGEDPYKSDEDAFSDFLVENWVNIEEINWRDM
jgi:hypothetical protein